MSLYQLMTDFFSDPITQGFFVIAIVGGAILALILWWTRRRPKRKPLNLTKRLALKRVESATMIGKEKGINPRVNQVSAL